MSAALAVRRRQLRSRRGLGMPGDNNRILDLARRLRVHVDAPVLGGIAVYLHGYERSTTNLDYYARDLSRTAAELEAAGARWSKARKEFTMEGVPVHLISADDTEVPIEKTSAISGIRVVTLKDLIAIKLSCGLKFADRVKDLGDVQELIRVIPLDKRFAGKLPSELRGVFKGLVDAVRTGERDRDGRRF